MSSLMFRLLRSNERSPSLSPQESRRFGCSRDCSPRALCLLYVFSSCPPSVHSCLLCLLGVFFVVSSLGALLTTSSSPVDFNNTTSTSSPRQENIFLFLFVFGHLFFNITDDSCAEKWVGHASAPRAPSGPSVSRF